MTLQLSPQGKSPQRTKRKEHKIQQRRRKKRRKKARISKPSGVKVPSDSWGEG